MGQFDVDTGAFAQEGQNRAAAQSQALMGIIAQHGQAGAEAYAQGQQAIAQQGSSAMSAAAGNARGSAVSDSGAFAGENNQRMQAIQGIYQQDMAAGNASFGRDMDRARSSNSDYMGQLSASLPIVAQNVQSQAQALGARAAAEQARREQERQMAELQLQQQREQIAATREARDRAAGGQDDPFAADKHQQYADAHDASVAALNTTDPKEADRHMADAKDRASLEAYNALGGINTNAAAAMRALLGDSQNGPMSFDDVRAKFRTPGGRKFDDAGWDLIKRLASSIQTAR